MTRKIIGICGYPRHGKTTAQRFLEDAGVVAIDDSRPLRDIAKKKYNLTEAQVSTQEGKGELILVDGVWTEIRKVLGDLGKMHEEAYGPNHWIELAIKTHITEAHPRLTSPISFGSVRMSQGHAVKAAGGIVVAVVNQRCESSDYDFDQFDRGVVDHWVYNDGTLPELQMAMRIATKKYLSQ